VFSFASVNDVFKMKRRKGWYWLAGVIGGMVSILLCCGATAFVLGLVSFPPTETLASRYLHAVINGDVEAATGLAGSEVGCRRILQEDIRMDIAQFGGAEIQNVTIEVLGGGGSDDEIEVAIVRFEYREPSQSEWQRGEMCLLTDHAVPGFRYICGNLNYHGP
jgi:hypothetical protein